MRFADAESGWMAFNVTSDKPLLPGDRGIIIAADVTTIDDLRSMVLLGLGVENVVGIKVGLSLALRTGLAAVVRAIRELTDLTVIYDHQKGGTDIPATGRLFAEACSEAGVQG